MIDIKIGDAFNNGKNIFVVNVVSQRYNVVTVKNLQTSDKMKFKLYSGKYYSIDEPNIQLGIKCDIGRTISPNINGKISLISKYKI